MGSVIQALILVGGKATRLRRDNVQVPISKAFLTLDGKPLLYWNLRILHKAGIQKLVIAGSTTRQLYEADKVVTGLPKPVRFKSVVFFRDEGLGVHGLPYELRYMLDDEFLFDCGHSLSSPTHYKKLIQAKSAQNVVFSAFQPHPQNRRQPVILDNGKVFYNNNGSMAVAHPIIADKNYAAGLAGLGFNIDRILNSVISLDSLRYILSDTPPEFDIEPEIAPALKAYRKMLAELAMI